MVTLVPSQIVVEGALMVTLGVTDAEMVMVLLFEFTFVGDAQVAFEVNSTYTLSPPIKFDLV